LKSLVPWEEHKKEKKGTFRVKAKRQRKKAKQYRDGEIKGMCEVAVIQTVFIRH